VRESEEERTLLTWHVFHISLEQTLASTSSADQSRFSSAQLVPVSRQDDEVEGRINGPS
jgi:hypothetical protein